MTLRRFILVLLVVQGGGCSPSTPQTQSSPTSGVTLRDLLRVGINIPSDVKELRIGHATLFTWMVAVDFVATQSQRDRLFRNSIALPKFSELKVDTECIVHLLNYSKNLMPWSAQVLENAVSTSNSGSRVSGGRCNLWHCFIAEVPATDDRVHIYLFYIEEACPGGKP